MTDVSVCLILDNSGSMRVPGKMEAAQTSTATFLYIMKTNDKVGVVNFNTLAHILYSDGATPPKLQTITSSTIQDAAKTAIMGLPASSGYTNITDSINKGFDLFPASPSNAGMILLSDGDWNRGGNPVPPPHTTIPIYTIGFMVGAAAGVTLSGIASDTSANYHAAISLHDLFQIYNTLAGTVTNNNVLVNQQEPLTPFAPQSIPMSVSSGNSKIQFPVNWDNQSITLAQQSIPKANEIAVEISNSSGVVTPTKIRYGKGFVVLEVDNPPADKYRLSIWPGSGVNVDSTAAALEPNGPTADFTLKASGFKKGDKVPFSIKLKHNDMAVKDARITVSVEAPLVSVENEPADDELNQIYVPLPRHVYPTSTTEKDSGEHHGEIDAQIPGSYTVKVNIEGKSPIDGVPFARFSRASVHVANS